MGEFFFSIIMPTYNSANTIELALKSIKEQTISQENIEILVIDGGSTDNTLEIARKYDAKIFKNEKKYPEYAKRIGFKIAQGHWVIMQDSDEVLTDKNQLQKRKDFFDNNPEVHCLILDKYIPGEKCGIACAYLNWFGDPFSYVVYNLSDSRIKSNRRNLRMETSQGNVYYYDKNDILPIGDGGTTTIDINYAKNTFGQEYYCQEFAVSAFSKIVSKTHFVGCIPEDNIIHYSLADFKSYLRKLQFRINTNLNEVEQSGYSVRATNSNKLKRRKYLFVLYVASIILPVFDSIKLAIHYKRPSLLLHCIYTYYVALMIGYELIKKIFGVRNKNLKYGK